MLNSKNIIVGVTGSIAAYKAAILVRELIKRGCNVKVIMTPTAKEFITPLTLATLSGSPVPVEFFNPENGEWNSHVKLGLWADALVIAPATAATIGKMCSGVADNLLVTTYLSAKCPVFISPAMDLDMYSHPSTKRNIKQLEADGVKVIEAGTGFLASGLTGKGRMAEPETIAQYLDDYFEADNALSAFKGLKVLITAGGTVEQIDSVRFISNYSSGKMGYALAESSKRAGADVTIVHAAIDANLRGSLAGVTEHEALSSEEMYQCVTKLYPDYDIVIMAAAIADFTPARKASHKLKKSELGDKLLLELVETKDIAAELGRKKKPGQILVGFALETNNEVENALKKIEKKNLDLIVLNSLKDSGAGFATDTNKITIISRGGGQISYPLKDKKMVADDIVSHICDTLLPVQH